MIREIVLGSPWTTIQNVKKTLGKIPADLALVQDGNYVSIRCKDFAKRKIRPTGWMDNYVASLESLIPKLKQAGYDASIKQWTGYAPELSVWGPKNKQESAWMRPEGVPKNWTEKYYNLYKAAYLESESAQKVSGYYVNHGATDSNAWHVRDNAIRLQRNAAELHKRALKLAPGPKEKKFHEQRIRYHESMVSAHPEPIRKSK